jgi:eukaryotic-like serine/threonine-protein kinase
MHARTASAGLALLALAASLAPPATAAEPAASPSGVAVLPPFTDAPEYRVDARRSGRVAGRGPESMPVLVWSRTIDGQFDMRPILSDGLILVGGSDHVFYGLDARTGADRWRYEAGDSVSGWGSASGGAVFFTSADGVLHALDLADGHERWSRPGMLDYTVAAADMVFAPSTDRHLYGLDPATGEVRWTWVAPADFNDDTGALSASDDTVYIGVTDGRLYAVSIPDAVERWHVQTVGKYANAVSLSADQAYVATPALGEPVGEMYVVDRQTGAVAWTFRTASGQNVGVGALGDGVAYVGTADDGEYALPMSTDASGSAPAPLWHVPMTGRSFRGQVLTDDTLYVPLADAPGPIMALDPATGTTRWQVPVAGGPTGIIVSGGMLFEADDSGTVAAYAEPALRDAIGQVTSGPLGAFVRAAPPDPFTVMRTLDAAAIGVGVPLAMDFGPDGLLYVLDSNPSVRVIDPTTDGVVRTWGRRGTGEGEFDVSDHTGTNPGVGDLDVGEDGLVYVADGSNHRLQVFTSDGTFVRQIGSYGTEEGQFVLPSQIITDPAENIYVIDDATSTVSKFGNDGAFLWRIGGAGSSDPAIRVVNDLRWLPDGHLAVVSTDGHVSSVDPESGRVVATWGEPGNQPGQMGASCRMTLDGAGNGYVFSCLPKMTQVFSPDHRLLGGSYAPRDLVLQPVFGPSGAIYALGIDDSFEKAIYRITVDLPAGPTTAPPAISPSAHP